MNQNNNKKLITIITVVKNGEATIERCIKSVLNQNYNNLEYIIIDGKSSDGTKDIINKYKNYIAKIIIEDDDGIWDAMNKGIKNASGEIVGFLNSDDYYFDNALETVNNYFSKNNIDFLFKYSLNSKVRKHKFNKTNLISKKNTLKLMITKIINFQVNFNKNEKISLFANKLSKKINESK